MKTFGKTFLEIDKMAGLRLKNANGNVLSVRGWDELHVPEIQGNLSSPDNALIWEGVLWTHDELENIFKPFGSDDLPITYARRSGKLGDPKNAGVLRLASSNGRDFLLQKCDGGEAVQKVVTSMQREKQIILRATIGSQVIQTALLDEARDHSKLIRLENLEI